MSIPVFGNAEKIKAQTAFFNTLDANSDGRLTEGEFLGFWEKNFNKRDSNGNGKLTQNEYAPSITKAGYELFLKLDKNQDGSVSWAEEKVLRAGHFVAMDKDKNEQVSLAEMLAQAKGK